MQISLFDIQEVNVAIISTDAYYVACKSKSTQIFALFIKDLEYQT